MGDSSSPRKTINSYSDCRQPNENIDYHTINYTAENPERSN